MPSAPPSPLPLLLLAQAALLASARAGAGATALAESGGAAPAPRSLAGGVDEGHKWYVEDYEHSFVEVLVLMVLVCLALLFETVWHYAAHHANDSYGYGQLTDAEAGACTTVEDGECGSRYQRVRHVQLYKELTNRAGGEFMTLGFLAFCVFIFNNTTGFEWLVRNFPSGEIHMPTTALDWLHLVEVVHIQLFMGMIFYFFLISRIVSGSVAKIRQWEQLRMRRVSVVQSCEGLFAWGNQGVLKATKHLNAADTELAKYMMWRIYFVERLLRWSDSRPLLYRKVLRSLNIDPQSRQSQDELRRKLEERFAFSAYLALNVEAGIRDSIVVHRTTWLSVLGILAVFELLCRFVHVDISIGTPVFITIVFVILAVMMWVVRSREARINRFAGEQMASTVSLPGLPTQASDPGRPDQSANFSDPGRHFQRSGPISCANTATLEDNRTFHQQHSTETIMLRLLQVVLFFGSYVFARSVLDITAWEENPQRVLLYCLLFTVLFLLLSHFLPSQVPTFLGLMALPPFEDAGNISLFFAVLADERNWQAPPAPRPAEAAQGGRGRADAAAAARCLPVLQGVAAKEEKGDLAAVCTFLLSLEQRLAEVEGRPAAPRLSPKGGLRGGEVEDDLLSGYSEGPRERLGVRPCSASWRTRAKSKGGTGACLDAGAASLAASFEEEDARAPADLPKMPSAWRLSCLPDRGEGAAEVAAKEAPGPEAPANEP